MLTVLCPDSLADSPDLTKAQQQLTARLRFAHRSRQHTIGEDVHSRVTPIEHWLATQFRLPAPLMVGAFSRFAEQPQTPGQADHALTIAPAHLHAGRDHLVLQPLAAIAPTHAEASDLIAAANAFFSEDGIRLEMVTPHTWLLHAPKPFDLSLSSSQMATGRSVEIYMPAGNDGRRLRALLNELQMLWHDHPVNHARDATHRLRINTVWAEGCAAPVTAPKTYQRVIADDPALRGLARACQTEAYVVADIAGAGLSNGSTLMQVESGAEAALKFLDEYNTHPLIVVLSSSLRWIELSVTPSDRWRRWRRNPLRP